MSKEPITLSREQLYERVWSMPMIKLAKECGLSDNGLRKICIKFKIPFPEVGYWQKLQYGKAVKKENLPSFEGEDCIKIHETKIGRPLIPSELAVKIKPENKVIVSNRLSKPHDLIKLAQEDRKERNKKNYSHKDRGVSVRVTNANFDRALRIMDTMLKAFEERDCEVIANNSNYSFPVRLMVHGEEVDIDLYETEKKVKKEKKGPYDYMDYEMVPTGLLTLRIDHYWEGLRMSWRDGAQQKVEDVLDDFVEGVFLVAAKEREIRIQREKEAQEREQKRRRLEELKSLKDEERKRIKCLEEDAANRHKSKVIRAFIEDKKQDYIQKNGQIDSGNDFDKWLTWANQQADRIDPFTPSPYSILDEKEPTDVW